MIDSEPDLKTMQGAWGRVRRVRASDEIVRQVRQAVFEGRLKAGDMLGSEGQLAEQFGVSRSTLRDALRGLEANGIVEIRTGVKGGVRIATGDPLRFADALAIQFSLVGVETEDAIAAQLGLDSVAAEFAALNADDDDIEAMRLILDKAEADVEIGHYVETSFAFHEALVNGSHNRVLITTLRAVHEIIKQPFLPRAEAIPERARRVLNAHKDIFAAIKYRDPENAARLMRAHLEVTREALIGIRNAAST